LEILDFLELTFIKGIGLKTLNKLLKEYSSPSHIFSLDFKTLEESFGKSVAERILYRDKSIRKQAERELLLAEKKRIEIIPITDPKYPRLLKEIPDPPIVLYAKGNINLLNHPSISIVGSRNHSTYGRVVTQKFSSELAKDGINIVSGMALGIDGIAHRSALDVKGFTTAVLGSGIDVIYPLENKRLYFQLIENGCVISEFPLGTQPSKWTFPQRNRIIAGLSYGTIIAEASEKSGALITAKYSVDYNRLVFSVPSNINNPFGRGNNLLLKEGAFPLTEKEDIYNELPFLKQEASISMDNQIELTPEETKIVSLVATPTHMDKLLELMDIDFDRLMEILIELEVKDIIKNENGIISLKKGI
jgi:DNA processing protein